MFSKLNLLLIILLAALLASCSQEQNSSKIVTGVFGGNYDAVGRAIAITVKKAVDADALNFEDELSAGSAENIDAVLAGRADFGLAQADQQHQAYNGTDLWSDRGPQNDLRSVFRLYPETVTLIAAGNSDIRTMDDLRGKRIDIGPSGSGTRQNAIAALSAAGIDWESDVKARDYVQNTSRLPDLMRDAIDAYFFTVGHPSRDVKFATYSPRGVRFVPLVNTAAILARHPYYSQVIISADQYPRAKNSEDVETIGTYSVLLTSADVPESVVYELTKAVVENLDSFVKYHPVLEGVRIEDMVKGLTVPLHPGAIRYFGEIGISVAAN